MRFPHTVTSNLHEGSSWAGIGASVWGDRGVVMMYVVCHSGFGKEALCWFGADQIDEVIGLFTDMKQRIGEIANAPTHEDNDE